MRKSSNVKSSGYTASRDVPIKKYEDRKVRFDDSKGFRDKKYEGYSIGSGPKNYIAEMKKDSKGNIKDKKLDEDYISNLHQHIYYLEMQLKLLYYFI